MRFGHAGHPPHLRHPSLPYIARREAAEARRTAAGGAAPRPPIPAASAQRAAPGGGGGPPAAARRAAAPRSAALPRRSFLLCLSALPSPLAFSLPPSPPLPSVPPSIPPFREAGGSRWVAIVPWRRRRTGRAGSGVRESPPPPPRWEDTAEKPTTTPPHPRPLQISSPQLRPGQRARWASPRDLLRGLCGVCEAGGGFRWPGTVGWGGGYHTRQGCLRTAGGGRPGRVAPGVLIATCRQAAAARGRGARGGFGRAPLAAGPAGLSAGLHPRPLPGCRSGRSGHGAAGVARGAAPSMPPRVQGERDRGQQCRMGVSGRIAVQPGAGQGSPSVGYECCSDESPIRDDSCPRPSVLPRGGRSLPSGAPPR